MHIRATVFYELLSDGLDFKTALPYFITHTATEQLRKNKPKLNEELLHNNKVCGVWLRDLEESISCFPNSVSGTMPG